MLPTGLVLTQTDAAGEETVNAYGTDPAEGSFGQLVAVTSAYGTADASTVQYRYDAAGNETAMIDAMGRETDYVYDALGNMVQQIDPSPDGTAPRPTTNYTYDSNGKVLTQTDPLGHVTSYVNCPFGLVVFQEDGPRSGHRVGRFGQSGDALLLQRGDGTHVVGRSLGPGHELYRTMPWGSSSRRRTRRAA